MKRKLITLFLSIVVALTCVITVYAADTVTINVSDPPQVGSVI